ncbi:EVE domain-containing protein [Candidatus Gracilibacteria bacterium]|nr:EVE domain-containing protein [Candidatus Gracilibacteria bacterium]
MQNYYIICVCLEHTKRGIAGGFIQSNHGKSTNIKKLKTGDGILIYSSKYIFTPENTEENKLQAFTALGYVRDEELYQGDMGGGFTPFRRNIDFEKETKQIPIIPLLSDLEFVKDVKKWGFPLMYGFLQISKHDFDLIALKMISK